MATTHGDHRIGDPLGVGLPVPAGASVADILDATIKGLVNGDLCYFDATNNLAKPANAIAWNTSLALTQADFAGSFCGVLLGEQPDGNAARDLTFAQSGIFEFPCASAAFDYGTKISVAKQTGSALERSKVVAATTQAGTIGVVAEQYTAATTLVRVRIIPLTARTAALLA